MVSPRLQGTCWQPRWQTQAAHHPLLTVFSPDLPVFTASTLQTVLWLQSSQVLEHSCGCAQIGRLLRLTCAPMHQPMPLPDHCGVSSGALLKRHPAFALFAQGQLLTSCALHCAKMGRAGYGHTIQTTCMTQSARHIMWCTIL